MQKKIPSQNEHKSANLWLGFALGSVTVGLLSYFFGTKKGRENLKKLIELTENLGENIEKIAEEVEKLMIEKTHEEMKDKPGIGNLLDKMKMSQKNFTS